MPLSSTENRWTIQKITTLNEHVLTHPEEQSFASLDEARSHLETLGRTAQELREQLLENAKDKLQILPPEANVSTQFCLKHTTSRLIHIDRDLQSRLDECSSGFASWKRRFSLVYRTRDPSNRDLLFLQIRFFYASFTLDMSRATSEQLADTFTDQFIQTLDNIELILRPRFGSDRMGPDESAIGPIADDFMQSLDLINGKTSPKETALDNSSDSWRPPPPSEANKVRVTGIFEIGVLHALFGIASKCRTSSLRRRAIQLLKQANRSETFISSQNLAVYAEAIMHLEEAQTARLLNARPGQQHQYSADEIPDEARFLDVVASAGLDESGTFFLSCTRRLDVSAKKIEVLEYACQSDVEDFQLTSSTCIDID